MKPPNPHRNFATNWRASTTSNATRFAGCTTQMADALPRLATALELADLDTREIPGALLDQHFACCEMLEAMKKLDLGKYL
jgi:hypothetical protein